MAAWLWGYPVLPACTDPTLLQLLLFGGKRPPQQSCFTSSIAITLSGRLSNLGHSPVYHGNGLSVLGCHQRQPWSRAGAL